MAVTITAAAGPVPGRSSLYDYRTSVQLQDEFATGISTSGSIGSLGWATSGGTNAFITPESSHPGILRRDTGGTINTLSTTFLYGANRQFLGSEDYSWLFVARLNTSDALTLVRIGMLAAAANPTVAGIYFEKLDADTNWFCVTRLSSSETRVDTGVAVTTNFTTFSATKDAGGAIFYINNMRVAGPITDTLPNVCIPMVLLNNGEAASKTIDVDYFEQRITVNR